METDYLVAFIGGVYTKKHVPRCRFRYGLLIEQIVIKEFNIHADDLLLRYAMNNGI